MNQAFVRYILRELLEYEDDLHDGTALDDGFKHRHPRTGELLQPDYILARDGKATVANTELVIKVYPPGTALERNLSTEFASPARSLVHLMHSLKVPVGLLTDGEKWILVYGQSGETTGFSVWHSRIWSEERITFNSFQTLLHVRRFLGVRKEDTLASIFARSKDSQIDVTNQLGIQVRRVRRDSDSVRGPH